MTIYRDIHLLGPMTINSLLLLLFSILYYPGYGSLTLILSQRPEPLQKGFLLHSSLHVLETAFLYIVCIRLHLCVL